MLKSRSFLFIAAMLFLASCSSDKSFLEKYYNDNLKLHSEMQDSLAAFCKRYDTKVYLTKRAAPPEKIHFNIFFNDIPGYTYITYDSALQRHDNDPARTSGFIVPASLVENFNRSVYEFVFFENNQAFFGYKAEDKAFARDVTYIGILTPANETHMHKGSKKISANAVITSHYLP